MPSGCIPMLLKYGKISIFKVPKVLTFPFGLYKRRGEGGCWHFVIPGESFNTAPQAGKVFEELCHAYVWCAVAHSVCCAPRCDHICAD
uniref:Uncharacterized protein n=1 Tax=Pyxicephalus adspersus TaxID=30357 RepID=A0AAV3ATM7_PYXAD|nr:TPA: hypothetical protein GDO54_000079 [Pyxicephalus adspersus]